MMMSSLRYSIEQTKIDALVGEKLLQDTEQFFRNNKALRNMINEYTPSVKRVRKTSAKRAASHIY